MTHETGRATNVHPSSVSGRDDFADFLQAVLQDFEASGKDWENGTLGRFLDGLTAVSWSRRVDVQDEENASWQLFAEMIAAATGYE